MEKMDITVVAARRCGDHAVGIGHVYAQKANLHIRVEFEVAECMTSKQLWDEARDQILRYLDVA